MVWIIYVLPRSLWQLKGNREIKDSVISKNFLDVFTININAITNFAMVGYECIST